MRIQNIEIIKKRHHREWLLIAVDEIDETTTTPLTGRLIAHSPHRDEVYNRMVKARGLTVALYSDSTLPQGYAVAFRA